MSIQDAINSASRFAASRWQAARSEGREEEGRLWSQVSGHRDFLEETGQVYLFEDYLQGVVPTSRPSASLPLGARQGATARRVMQLLLKAFDETPEPEQKQSATVLLHVVRFLADTGQVDAVEDYVNNRLEYAPLAIAHFATREEAAAWLKGLAQLPSPARILIGDEYHLVWGSREGNTRGLYRDYTLEPYIEELVARGIPPTTPSFETRAEAEAWLKSHPASPFAFVSVAGEHFLAVHHKNLRRHTLHPVAAALAQWEEQKRVAERERDATAGDG